MSIRWRWSHLNELKKYQGQKQSIYIFLRTLTSIVSIIKLLDLPSNRLDELFIKYWTLEGAVNVQGAAITIWRFLPMTNQIVYRNFGKPRFRVKFFFNNSSRRSSRCPRTISLDDRDYDIHISQIKFSEIGFSAPVCWTHDSFHWITIKYGPRWSYCSCSMTFHFHMPTE